MMVLYPKYGVCRLRLALKFGGRTFTKAWRPSEGMAWEFVPVGNALSFHFVFPGSTLPSTGLAVQRKPAVCGGLPAGVRDALLSWPHLCVGFRPSLPTPTSLARGKPSMPAGFEHDLGRGKVATIMWEGRTLRLPPPPRVLTDERE